MRNYNTICSLYRQSESAIRFTGCSSRAIGACHRHSSGPWRGEHFQQVIAHSRQQLEGLCRLGAVVLVRVQHHGQRPVGRGLPVEQDVWVYGESSVILLPANVCGKYPAVKISLTPHQYLFGCDFLNTDNTMSVR